MSMPIIAVVSVFNGSLDITTDKTTRNNPDIVKWCKNAYANGWGYVYGGYGQVYTYTGFSFVFVNATVPCTYHL